MSVLAKLGANSRKDALDRGLQKRPSDNTLSGHLNKRTHLDQEAHQGGGADRASALFPHLTVPGVDPDALRRVIAVLENPA